MRQRLTILLTFVVIIGVLVVLNLASYVQKTTEDTEQLPNRSTYHSGPTGTRAIYDFLNESGYKVIRWREQPDLLFGQSGHLIKTLVLVGPPKVSFTEEDTTSLLRWIYQGGHFVLIDRWPDESLLPSSRHWTVTSNGFVFPADDVDPASPRDMTEGALALTPVQPTALTRSVQSVMPSRFASRIQITYQRTGAPEGTESIEEHSPAPVTHIADNRGALLVDYVYGKGRIVLLTDPYVIANGGIGLKDNLLLDVNVLTNSGGLIAFDEYHQGRGVTSNPIATYFAGTPVLSIGAQIVLLVVMILWTKSRRFARPLPLPAVDRRSSLEFVASMAELQERSKAYDLALENIYMRTRRALARYAAVDYNSPRSMIASRVASRSSLDAHRVEVLMRQCEEVINGLSISWRQCLDLVRRLRELERSLGLLMRSRDARQAAKNI
jgi:hypothetical protein